MSAEAAVNLPGDQLGMVAERLGHVFDHAFGSVPKNVAVEADGAARAFVLDQAVLVERQNFRMFFGQPDGRRGGGRAENDLDVVLRHDVHHAAQPEEIVFAFFGFAEAPGKFADADDVDAGLGHQFGIVFPSALGVVGGAGVREDPLLRIIINAKKHNLNSRASIGV